MQPGHGLCSKLAGCQGKRCSRSTLLPCAGGCQCPPLHTYVCPKPHACPEKSATYCLETGIHAARKLSSTVMLQQHCEATSRSCEQAAQPERAALPVTRRCAAGSGRRQALHARTPPLTLLTQHICWSSGRLRRPSGPGAPGNRCGDCMRRIGRLKPGARAGSAPALIAACTPAAAALCRRLARRPAGPPSRRRPPHRRPAGATRAGGCAASVHSN